MPTPVTPLAAYLDARAESSAAFAARIGVGQPVVWRWREGKRIPTIAMAVRIEEETAGAVPVKAWVPKVVRRSARRQPRKPSKNAA